MKKLFPFLIIISLLCFNAPIKVSADLDAIGGPIAAGAWATQHAGMAASLVKEAMTSYATMSLNTKEYVLDPLARLFGQKAVNDIANNTKNWALSGFNGNPTFITDPGSMANNIAMNVVRTNVANLTGNPDNIFAGSVVNHLVKSARSEKDSLDKKLAPTIAKTIQNNVCTDSKLTELAKNYLDAGVSVGDDNSLETIKSNLRNELCEVSTNPKAQQKKQLELYANSSEGSNYCWDCWLNLTSDPKNNLTGQTIIANTETAKTQDKKKEEVKMVTVDGIRPIADCVDTPTLEVVQNDFYNSPTAGANNPNKLPCQKELITNPAQYIANQVKTSVNNINQSVVGADEFAELAPVIIGFVGGQLSDFMFSGSGTGQSITMDTLEDPFNVPFSTSTPKNKPIMFSGSVLSDGSYGDSTDNMSSTTKDVFTKAMFTDLDYNKTTATQLKSTITKYRGFLSAHDSRIDTLASCYANVESVAAQLKAQDGHDYLQYVSSNLNKGKAYVSSEKKFVSDKNAELDIEFTKADFTLAEISKLINFIKGSSDSSAINEHYLDFNDKLKYGEYVTSSEAESRRQEQASEEKHLSDQDIYNYQSTGNVYNARLYECNPTPPTEYTVSMAQTLYNIYASRHNQ